MVWAHETVKYSFIETEAAEIYTLSPWPIPDYWEWTRQVNADDYVFS